MTFLDEQSGSVSERIDRRRLVQIAGLAGLATVGVVRLGDRILAQGGATPPVVPQLPANITLIAQGLENPQYLAIAADGRFIVSETGAFESDTIVASPVAGTPAPAGRATVHGETGLVSSVTPDGTRTVIVDGLPSYLAASGANGPAGLSLVEGGVLVVTGGAGAAISDVTPYPNENSLLRIDLATGAVTNIANIGAYETANNPDGFAISSNCRGLAVVEDVAYVSDAGGNTIYAIDLATGELRPLAVIPGIPVAEPNPERQGLNEIDPVPSGLAAAPDGTLLVGFVGGAPVASGSAGILKVALDGTV
ncbi:MAG: ScyD/ScyE family protein, partial [Thermomicrobiales bacterium]